MPKIFSKIIKSKITNMIEDQQSKEQAGFRRIYSKINHLFTINQVTEKAQEHYIELHLAFIDCTKEFDTTLW